MTGAPVLGLLVDFRPPPHWETLVRTLGRWCVPEVADPLGDSPAAWLASSPGVTGLGRVAAGGTRVAVLTVDDSGQPVMRVDAGPAIPFPREGLDVGARLAMTPFVRARWRRRFGLPLDLVVRGDDGLPEDLVPTALAVAAAVVAQGPALLAEALAWGAPCATDAASASAVAAGDGREVVVADDGSVDAAAASLAVDDRRAAALSRAGRRLVERHHDTVRPARELARRLGLFPPAQRPMAGIEEQLDQLWTPADARIRHRVAEAASGLLERTGV